MTDPEPKKKAKLNWKVLLGAALGLGILGFSSLIGLIFYYSLDLPEIESLADYTPPQVTKIYSDDGHLVGRLFSERRTVVPTKEIPEHVIHAFLAAEDATFYQHAGIDYLGILRAAFKNLRPGAHLQGASTITQQTVKTMIVGAERSYARKMREALLARRLEQEFTKDDILHLYLNQIWFGGGAYGIEEASQTYFGKSIRDLKLGEGAYLAAIPKHPNRYTIKKDAEAAKERQGYVLRQMQRHGWADAAQVEAELAKPIPRPADPPPYLGKAPHYVEHVKKLLTESLGEEQATQGGLTVYTGMHAESQQAAHDALRHGLQELSKRHGYPGATFRIEVDKLQRSKEALKEAYQKHMERRKRYGLPQSELESPILWDLSDVGERSLADIDLLTQAVVYPPLKEGLRVTGIVEEIDSAGKQIGVDLGCCSARISLESMAWARPFAPLERTREPKDPSQVASVGDLVQVEIQAFEPEALGDGRPTLDALLIPIPKAEGALVSIDPYTRLVRSLVGGYQPIKGKFNRATQSRRQPGSSFKPIVYATGIAEKAITPASICTDAPVVVPDPWTGKQWKPQNYEDGRFDGLITYRTALTRSKNTCSIKLAERITPAKIIEMARNLGIKSPLPENLTVALGTGEVTPLELANAYATIASGGIYADPIFIRKITSSSGEILVENRAEPVEALAPSVAYVVAHMMRSVVEQGTATKALVLERPLAGKTGTTNQSRSVWFSGFSSELVATVYVGFDNNEPLGRATGSSAALPIWVEYMARALKDVPIHEFEPPEDVVTVRVDPITGRLSEAESAIDEVFLVGTEPTEQEESLPSIFDVDEPLMEGGAP